MRRASIEALQTSVTLASAGFDHRPRLQRRDHPDAQKLLSRAHRAVSNLKT